MLTAPIVVKVGGNEVDDARWVAALAGTLARHAAPVVLVHGGGKEVTEVQRTLGAEPLWVGGLRVTTPQALRAACMVLSGVVNKRLVAALIGAGRPALGLSGEDGPLLLARPALEGRLGRTGEVTEVRPAVLRALLAAGLLPVVSPLSRGPDGGPLNVNADEAAAAIAVGLGAERFLMVSNVAGVLRDGMPLETVETGAVEALIAEGVADGGMAPKLRAAARAAAGGVMEVQIGDLSLLTGASGGTRVTARPPLAAIA